MLRRLQSPSATPSRRRIKVRSGVYLIWSCLLLFLLPLGSVQWANAQQGLSEVFRIEVTDEETNHPLPNAGIRIGLWTHENGVRRKRELESKTNENGIAVFPKIRVEGLTVTVDAKGYRSSSRWINPRDFARPIRIRLEKWRRIAESSVK